MHKNSDDKDLKINWHSDLGYWEAYYKNIYIGRFETPEKAYKAFAEFKQDKGKVQKRTKPEPKNNSIPKVVTRIQIPANCNIAPLYDPEPFRLMMENRKLKAKLASERAAAKKSKNKLDVSDQT